MKGSSRLCLLNSPLHSLPYIPPHPTHYTPWEYLWLQVTETQIKPCGEKINSFIPVSEKLKGSAASGMLDSSAQESLPLTQTWALLSSLLPLFFDRLSPSGGKVGLHGHYCSSSQKGRHLHQVLKKIICLGCDTGQNPCVQGHGVLLLASLGHMLSRRVGSRITRSFEGAECECVCVCVCMCVWWWW